MTNKARKALLTKMKNLPGVVEQGHIYVCEVTSMSIPSLQYECSIVLTIVCVEKNSDENMPVESISTRSEKHMYVKVGCSKHPGSRLKEWENDCAVNHFDLHGIWPKPKDSHNRPAPNREDCGDLSPWKYFLEGELLALFRFGDTGSQLTGLIKHELAYLAKSSAHLPEEERPVAPARERCPCKLF